MSMSPLHPGPPRRCFWSRPVGSDSPVPQRNLGPERRTKLQRRNTNLKRKFKKLKKLQRLRCFLRSLTVEAVLKQLKQLKRVKFVHQRYGHLQALTSQHKFRTLFCTLRLPSLFLFSRSLSLFYSQFYSKFYSLLFFLSCLAL